MTHQLVTVTTDPFITKDNDNKKLDFTSNPCTAYLVVAIDKMMFSSGSIVFVEISIGTMQGGQQVED